MLKGAKKELSMSEAKDIIIMPSTKPLSKVVNSLGGLMFLAAFLIGLYITGIIGLIWGVWYIGLAQIAGTFLFARVFDYFTRTKGKRQGYIKANRDTANDLIRVERAYAKLSKEDQDLYKGYLEAAYYGEATPIKVHELFVHKQREAIEKPKALDDLIDLELPKD